MGVEEYEWTISEWIVAEEDLIIGDMDFLIRVDALLSATSSGTPPRPTRNPRRASGSAAHHRTQDVNGDPIPDSPWEIPLLGNGDGSKFTLTGDYTGKKPSPSGLAGAGMVCYSPSPFSRVPVYLNTGHKFCSFGPSKPMWKLDI
jgi:hypothetical protein